MSSPRWSGGRGRSRICAQKYESIGGTGVPAWEGVDQGRPARRDVAVVGFAGAHHGVVVGPTAVRHALVSSPRGVAPVLPGALNGTKAGS